MNRSTFLILMLAAGAAWAFAARQVRPDFTNRVTSGKLLVVVSRVAVAGGDLMVKHIIILIRPSRQQQLYLVILGSVAVLLMCVGDLWAHYDEVADSGGRGGWE